MTKRKKKASLPSNNMILMKYSNRLQVLQVTYIAINMPEVPSEEHLKHVFSIVYVPLLQFICVTKNKHACSGEHHMFPEYKRHVKQRITKKTALEICNFEVLAIAMLNTPRLC